MKNKFECIVIGVSAGGMTAMQQILPFLPKDFPLPIIIVQHLHPHQSNYHIQFFNKKCKIPVKEAQEKENIRPGIIYFAPANYHLLVEYDRTFSLSVDRKVNYSRPSIDVLIESAIEVYRNKLIGIILTGANNDGAKALMTLTLSGGCSIVQNPKTAEVDAMPKNAINLLKPSHIFDLKEIKDFLLSIK